MTEQAALIMTNANGLLDIGCEPATAAVTVFGGKVDIGVVKLSKIGDSDALYSFFRGRLLASNYRF